MESGPILESEKTGPEINSDHSLWSVFASKYLILAFAAVIAVASLTLVTIFYQPQHSPNEDSVSEVTERDTIPETYKADDALKDAIREDSLVTEESRQSGLFTGYYESFEKSAWESTSTCHALIVTSGHKQLVQYFIDTVLRGNTVQKLDDSGNLVLNLPWEQIPKPDQERIGSSDENNHITVLLRKKYQAGKEAIACHSFFDYSRIEPSVQTRTIKKSLLSTPDTGEIEFRFLNPPGLSYSAGAEIDLSWRIEWSDGSRYNSPVNAYLVSEDCDITECLLKDVRAFKEKWPEIIAISEYTTDDRLDWGIPNNFLLSGNSRIVIVQTSEAAGRMEILGVSDLFEIKGGIEFSIYRNEELGFEFEYPAQYEIWEPALRDNQELILRIGVVNEHGNVDEKVGVVVFQNAYDDLSSWLADLRWHATGDNFGPLLQDAKVRDVMVGEIQGKEVTPAYGYSKSPTVYFIKGDRGFVVGINHSDVNSPRTSGYDSYIAEELISSFTFLND